VGAAGQRCDRVARRTKQIASPIELTAQNTQDCSEDSGHWELFKDAIPSKIEILILLNFYFSVYSSGFQAETAKELTFCPSARQVGKSIKFPLIF
jgi:hypothetical protein